MRICFIALATVATLGCKIEKLPPSGPSSDNFDRAAIGEDWLSTGANWRIENGALSIDHAYNHPLWLKKAIPQDAVIEVDCWSDDPSGDIKLEAWGDGHSFAQTVDYDATSYVFIFGGWHNTISAIARLEEHGHDRRPRSDVRVVPGQHYHWRIARKGGHIDWQIDGKPFLTFDDRAPADRLGSLVSRLQRLGSGAALRQSEGDAEPLALKLLLVAMAMVARAMAVARAMVPVVAMVTPGRCAIHAQNARLQRFTEIERQHHGQHHQQRRDSKRQPHAFIIHSLYQFYKRLRCSNSCSMNRLSLSR